MPIITAYLIHFGPDENPKNLAANAGIAFKGAEPGSLGFLVPGGGAEYAAFRELRNPADPAKPVLKLYVGGKSQNRATSERYVIDVNGLSEEQIKQIPEVEAYLRNALRPDLLKRGEIEEGTSEWWHFRRPTAGLNEALRPLSRCMACSRHSPHLAIEFRSTAEMLSESMVVFASQSYALFAILQSSVHEIWARIMASSMKDDLRYTPSDTFGTFPFPLDHQHNVELEDSGRKYYEFRAALMSDRKIGLTKTYNGFHDEWEQSEDFEQFRVLRDAMDNAVLRAYEWSDLRPVTVFEDEFRSEDEDDEAIDPSEEGELPKQRRRWPEEIRDDVLARLLILNEQRAAEEAPEKKTIKRKSKHMATPLFDSGDKE